jgi:hypothetical protein
MENFQHQKSESFDNHGTESASSPDTVINVSSLRRQDSIDPEYEDDFLEEDVEIKTPNPEVPSTLFAEMGEPLRSINITSIKDDTSFNFSEANSTQSSRTTESEKIEKTERAFTRSQRDVKEKEVKEKEDTATGSSRTRRRKYPDPRKPSQYPQRLNKVTLARQALAREKRRAYVEERIQRYLRSSQSNVVQRGHNKCETTSERNTMVSRSLATTTSPPPQPLAELQMQRITSATSLPNLDSNNYYVNNPSPILLPQLPHTSIPVARIHTRKSSFKSLPPSSASSLPMPHILFNNSGFNRSTAGLSLFQDTESIPEHSSCSHILNSMEQQSYFYSFRVRQVGPVEMLDKSVQTAKSEFSHGYTLDFSSTSQSQNYSVSQALQRANVTLSNIPKVDSSKFQRVHLEIQVE